MIDAARAIVWMRSHAGALGLLPDKIAVCGFSAGGHLAAGTAILWDGRPGAGGPGGGTRAKTAPTPWC